MQPDTLRRAIEAGIKAGCEQFSGVKCVYPRCSCTTPVTGRAAIVAFLRALPTMQSGWVKLYDAHDPAEQIEAMGDER